MSDLIPALNQMDYPGRIIIIGLDPSGRQVVVGYAVTGRSPSSQARRLASEKSGIWVQPANEKILNTGDIELLIYPAILIGNTGIVVSNGKQTPDVLTNLSDKGNPVEILSRSLSNWNYEPDDPNFTPRISGCFTGSDRAALSILKRGVGGDCLKYYYDFVLNPGKGRMIATYTGENCNPLPSFLGEPVEIKLAGRTPEEVASAFYSSLAPKKPDKDFRVAAACIFASKENFRTHTMTVINRHDLKGS